MIKHATLACLIALTGVCGPTLFAQGKNTAKEELPTGEAILDKYIEATGGTEAWGKVKNIAAKGNVVMIGQGRGQGMSMTGNATMYGGEPNLFSHEMRVSLMGQMGIFITGCDGKNAWEITPDGRAKILSGKELETELEKNNLNEANWRDRYVSAQTKGTKKVEGEECFEVIVTTKAGNTFASYYSKKTGLKVKEDNQVFKDYKDAGGVLMPFTQIIDEDGVKVTLKFKEIKVNVDIPPGTFDPPPQIKGMPGIK
jgi:outer membrane lipoprotein-sorting protein